MTTDPETLRRHEAALCRVRASDGTLDAVGEERAAIGWALTRVREAIATAEADAELARERESRCPATFCVNGVVYPRSKDGGGPGSECSTCKGTGKR
jgi:hypothetical protein